MKNFKEMLDKDLDSTFYNLEEFAQLKRVKCDGIDKKIPVILDLRKQRNGKTLFPGIMRRDSMGNMLLSGSG